MTLGQTVRMPAVADAAVLVGDDRSVVLDVADAVQAIRAEPTR